MTKIEYQILINNQYLMNQLKNVTTKIHTKGSMCSVSGNNYEKQVYNVAKRCTLYPNYAFNTQCESELAGSSSKHDLVCNYKNKTFGIEIKNTTHQIGCNAH